MKAFSFGFWRRTSVNRMEKTSEGGFIVRPTLIKVSRWGWRRKESLHVRLALLCFIVKSNVPSPTRREFSFCIKIIIQTVRSTHWVTASSQFIATQNEMFRPWHWLMEAWNFDEFDGQRFLPKDLIVERPPKKIYCIMIETLCMSID